MATPTANGLEDLSPHLRQVTGLVFDLIGTCTNWHPAVATCLHAHASRTSDARINSQSQEDWGRFAHLWRSEFFKMLARLADNEQYMEMLQVYGETLRTTMKQCGVSEGYWNQQIQDDLVKSWQMVDAWADTSGGLRLLRSKFDVIGLSNGAMASTIAINKRNDLQYDALISSDIVGAYKPNDEMYKIALRALQAPDHPEQLAMVASHAYDLEAAAKHGMRTIYIKRSTEDMDLDIGTYNFDLVINEGGLVELARRLGCDV